MDVRSRTRKVSSLGSVLLREQGNFAIDRASEQEDERTIQYMT